MGKKANPRCFRESRSATNEGHTGDRTRGDMVRKNTNTKQTQHRGRGETLRVGRRETRRRWGGVSVAAPRPRTLQHVQRGVPPEACHRSSWACPARRSATLFMCPLNVLIETRELSEKEQLAKRSVCDLGARWRAPCLTQASVTRAKGSRQALLRHPTSKRKARIPGSSWPSRRRKCRR